MKCLFVCMALIFCGKIFSQELYKQTSLFTEIDQYPKINNEKAFIKALKQNLHYEEERTLPRIETINYFKKIKLFGSNNEFYLLEYDYHDGSTSGYPWKDQFVFTKAGKLVGQMHSMRVDVVTIFPGKLPFLFTVSSTGHGNGWHNVYRIRNGKMIDVYDHFLGNRPQTYTTGGGSAANIPKELYHRFTDVNKDGFTDIVFYGKTRYYKNDADANPPTIINVRYVFLYHPNTGHFTEREDYSKKYEFIFGNTKY